MAAWSKFQNDFNAMSDNDITDENRRMADQLDEAEEWLEAVSAWEAAGRPRASDAEGGEVSVQLVDADHDASLDDLTDEGFGDRGPTLLTLGKAIQCWSLTNLEARTKELGWREAVGPTLGEAALAFAIPIARIKAAVENHYWMFLTGDGPDADLVIEHEGE